MLWRFIDRSSDANNLPLERGGPAVPGQFRPSRDVASERLIWVLPAEIEERTSLLGAISPAGH